MSKIYQTSHNTMPKGVSFKGGLQAATEEALKYAKKWAPKRALMEAQVHSNTKEVPFTSVLGLLTAFTSALGFGVGGAGLLYDQALHGNGKKQKPKTTQEKAAPPRNAAIKSEDLYSGFNINNNLARISQSFKGNDKVQSLADPQLDLFKEFHAQEIYSHKDGNSNENAGGEGSVHEIAPESGFGKIGLKFAKVGIGFSGVAGIFNGIAMKLPLMAFGEGLNVAASPIIQTPVGLGLFGVALAAVFAGRALENDPLLKLNTAVLRSKKGPAKLAYILSNTLNSAKEVGKSFTTISKNIFKLAGNNNARKSAIRFFKDEVFSIIPKTVIFSEEINFKGLVNLKTMMKSSPYLMHAASTVLAAGGLLLTIGSLLRIGIVQKLGLKTFETGGSLDNLSLSKWGAEKYVLAENGSAKAAGAMLAASGLTILSGQPAVDEKWGRGLQWAGCSLLFSVFAVERLAELVSAVKGRRNVTSTLPTQLIRQWQVNLVDLLKLQKGHDLEKAVPKDCRKEFKKELIELIEIVKNGNVFSPALMQHLNKDENKLMRALFESMKELKYAAKYDQGQTSEQLQGQLAGLMKEKGIEESLAEKAAKLVTQNGKEGNYNQLLESTKIESDKLFSVESPKQQSNKGDKKPDLSEILAGVGGSVIDMFKSAKKVIQKEAGPRPIDWSARYNIAVKDKEDKLIEQARKYAAHATVDSMNKNDLREFLNN